MALPVPFTVRETAGIARTGNDPLWFPVSVPFAQADNVLTTDGLAVRDMVSNTLIPAQLVPHTRYGNYGDASRPLATALLYFRPTLTANERRLFRVEVGTNPAASAQVVVTPTASVWSVDTGTGGAIFEIPRTGAMSVLRKCTMKTGEVVINSDNGGLVVGGVATNAQGVVESQAAEYASKNDTSGDGTTNNAFPTERFITSQISNGTGPRPTKWATSVLLSGPEVACIKISCARMKTAGGVAFKGKGKFQTGSGVICNWDMTCDTYLWFFAGTSAFVADVINKSTGAHASGTGQGHASLPIADCSVDYFGLDLALTWTGSGTKITVADEQAAAKATQAAVTASAVLRQRSAPGFSDTSYHFTVDYSGVTPAGANTALLHALMDSTKSDDSMGCAVFPWNWRNYYPQGLTWDLTTGLLRWEMLNPAEPDVEQYWGSTNGASRTGFPYHMIGGAKQPRWTAWIFPHAGLLTTTQLVDRAKRHAGLCETVSNGVYSAMTPTGPGGQIPSMLGSVDSEIWHATKAYWDSLPPNDLVATKAAMRARMPLGSTGAKAMGGLPSETTGAFGNQSYSGGPLHYPAFANTTRGEDALDMLERWRYVRIDGVRAKSAEPSGFNRDDLYWQAQYRVGQPVTAGNTRLGWRNYTMQATSGSSCGANDFQAIESLGRYWLLTEERMFWLYYYTSARHHQAMDLEHGAFWDDWSAAMSSGYNYEWQGGPLHASNGGLASRDLQQMHDDYPMTFVLTGDPMAKESMDWVLDAFGKRFLGEIASTLTNTFSNEGTAYDTVPSPDIWVTGTFTAGSGTVTNISDTSRMVPNAFSGWILGPNNGGRAKLLSVNHATKTATFGRDQANQFPPTGGVSFLLPSRILQSRGWTFPLSCLVRIVKVLGANHQTSYVTQKQSTQPTRPTLAAFLRLMMEKCVHSSEWTDSDALRATEQGGTGLIAAKLNPPDTFYQVETFAGYPARPWRDTYIHLTWLQANGWASDVPTSILTQSLVLIERCIKTMLTGTNGLDWSQYWTDLTTSPWARKLPWTTGGHVQSPTSALVHFSQPFGCAMWVADGAKTSIDNMNPWPAAYDHHKYGNQNFQGACAINTTEVLAWLALEKYHAEADTARRDHALDLAVMGLICNVLWEGNSSYPTIFSGRVAGQSYNDPYMFNYSDPRFTFWVSSYLSTTNPDPKVRNKNWIGCAGEYSLRLLVSGFPDAAPGAAALVAAVTTTATAGADGLQDVTQILLAAEVTTTAGPVPTPELLSTVVELGERQLAGNRSLIGSPRPLRPKDTTLRAAVFSAVGATGFITTDVDVAGAPSGTVTVAGALQAGQLTETFTGADSAAGTLNADGTWTQLVGTAWKTLSNMAVVENGPVWGTVVARRENDLGDDDWDISALIGDWTSLLATDMWLGVAVLSSSATTGYGVHVAKDANSTTHKVTIWKVTAGAFVALSAAPVEVPAVTAGSTVLRLRKVGTTITAYYEGQQIDQVTNGDLTGMTRPGIWAGQGPRSGTVRCGFDSLTADVAA